jgi:hypothetical protein
MKSLNPYVMFSGNRREALTFHTECLGGEIVSLQTFQESQSRSLTTPRTGSSTLSLVPGTPSSWGPMICRVTRSPRERTWLCTCISGVVRSWHRSKVTTNSGQTLASGIGVQEGSG